MTAKRHSPTLWRMKNFPILAKLIIAGSLFALNTFAQQEKYPLHPDSEKQVGVPRGKVTQAKFCLLYTSPSPRDRG